ncbi:uncharacterized mitochondrial protein-like protein [Tanacetum coccineum]
MKNQETHKVNRKNWDEMMERKLGEGYSFIKKKCFVCGSLSHLIRDCDFYEKKMAREAELKKQRVFNTGNGVAKPVWNNANRVNHANHFVPRPVQLNTGRANVNSVRQNVNSVRPNVNTGRANVNSVRQNVNSVRSNVNTGSFNINTVKAKQPIHTSNSNSFSPVRPQVNKFNQRSHFSKSHSPVRRPIVRNTAKMSYTHAVKGNWGTAVKTSAGYNWRKTRPNSNCNSGSNFIRTDHPLKNMEDRGIFDSGCSGHMTGNKDHLDDFEECKGGSVTFGGSKGYITGKGRIRVGNLDFDSVSFVKELGHFNLFSISQICDKQHKVLFTETECLVVSPDFKMPDENQILLKVPRQHNMYSFDMKTPSLTKDYACLIAKATSDESKLWHRRTEGKKDIMLVQVYVDDIIFGSTRKSWCDEFEALMKGRFQMSSMGELIFFLGLQVKQKTDGIFISQDKYVADMLKKFDLASVKTAITPMETKMALTKDEEADEVDVHLYRSMIGSLMYLTASRPDIMFAVCACSRFQVTPKTSHLNAVKRIFKYLKGKPNLGLWYPRESSFDLEAYSDSDYAGANLDRKSTTGGCQFLGSRLISWQCKKQTINWCLATELPHNLADGTLELRATIDTLEYTITEASVRSKLQLADASRISMLPNTEIFKGMGNMGYPADGQAESSSETKVPQLQDPTHPYVAEERTMTVDDLLQLVPKLITKVDTLETELMQTKLTMGKALVKLVKKVKNMEDVLKRRHVVLPDSEDEDAKISSKQGRKWEEDIQVPTPWEAAKTLSMVASQRSKSVDKGKRYKRRKESKGKDIDIGFEDISTRFEDISTSFEYISTGFEEVNIGSLGVSTGSRPVSSARGQREGKAPMIVEADQASPKRIKIKFNKKKLVLQKP